MALTTSKMGLRIWNLLADAYDHTQLASDFSKVDLHDHTPGRGLQVPTEGIFPGAISRTLMGAWFQTAQTTSASIASGAYGNVTISWPVAFADTSYVPLITVGVASALAGSGSISKVVTSITTTNIVVQLYNGSNAAQTPTVYALGLHN